MIVNSDAKLSEAIGNLRSAYKEHRYVKMTLVEGKHRSLSANGLSHVWYDQIAKERGDQTPEEVKCECKLRYGVPILRANDPDFREMYDAAIKRTLTYEQKVKAMAYLPVTSLMTRGQMSDYMETLQGEFAKQGIELKSERPCRSGRGNGRGENDVDNQQGAFAGLRELALFAGAGGGILGGKLLGWRPVCAVECDAYAASVLAQRQNDGHLATFPIWSDIRSFNGKPWRGCVDVVSGGFPCQDISPAGRGEGIGGTKSKLWAEMSRIIDEVRPRLVFVENSDRLTGRGLGRVLGDLAALGYDAEWMCLSAGECGAPHARPRLWILAYSDSAQRERGCISSGVHPENTYVSNARWGKDKPGVARVAHDVAYRMDRLRAGGNGQVPRVAATAFCEIYRRMMA